MESFEDLWSRIQLSEVSRDTVDKLLSDRLFKVPGDAVDISMSDSAYCEMTTFLGTTPYMTAQEIQDMCAQ
jgi:hypothetical protein